MKTLGYCILFALFPLVCARTLPAQPQLEKDYSYVMEIPSVMAIESSPAHVYILSNTEGMVVFRTKEDTLQWLYSSTGMEQRGNTVTADIRFAYLYGYNRRLTVLEPTSVLGVYSSTLLPNKPLDAERMDHHLYVALGAGGLGRLSLRTPSAVDSAIIFADSDRLRGENIISLEASNNQLFALSGSSKLFVLNPSEDEFTISDEFSLARKVSRIFLSGGRLYGTDDEGNIYEINQSANLIQLGTIGEPVEKIQMWRDWLLIQGSSNRIWTSYQDRSPVLWKDDPKAGNFFTVAQGQLWLSEYNQISRIIPTHTSEGTRVSRASSVTGKLKLTPIENQIVPFPKPLLLSLDFESDFPMDQVQFAYQSDISTAKIKGNGFYWQPQANDVGQHRIKIIATASDGQTDSTSFLAEVRSFNAPPRFTPFRPMTIPVERPFTLPIKALDPDGMNQNLIRYLGVDLPEGASIDEQTGEFTWTPTIRQVGENKVRVIATEQYGAASSTDIVIRVVEATQSAQNDN